MVLLRYLLVVILFKAKWFKENKRRDVKIFLLVKFKSKFV